MDEPCLYKVLGVKPSASISEIRVGFKRLARRHHPDKHHNENPQNMDATPDEMSHHDMFSLVARAYEVLSDPTKRATYDILHGHQSISQYGKLSNMKRFDAERAVDLMKVSFDIKRRGELARGGLVIDDAVYGDVDLINSKTLEELVLSNQVINVTRQLQCAVENSKLIIPKGEPKFHWISGLYDPAPGRAKLLWVRYYFRGKLHRVVVHDQDRLLMPLKSHAVRKNLPRAKAVHVSQRSATLCTPTIQAVRFLVVLSTFAGLACALAPSLKLGMLTTWRGREQLLHFAGLDRRHSPTLVSTM